MGVEEARLYLVDRPGQPLGVWRGSRCHVHVVLLFATATDNLTMVGVTPWSLFDILTVTLALRSGRREREGVEVAEQTSYVAMQQVGHPRFGTAWAQKPREEVHACLGWAEIGQAVVQRERRTRAMVRLELGSLARWCGSAR